MGIDLNRYDYSLDNLLKDPGTRDSKGALRLRNVPEEVFQINTKRIELPLNRYDLLRTLVSIRKIIQGNALVAESNNYLGRIFAHTLVNQGIGISNISDINGKVAGYDIAKLAFDSTEYRESGSRQLSQIEVPPGDTDGLIFPGVSEPVNTLIFTELGMENGEDIGTMLHRLKHTAPYAKGFQIILISGLTHNHPIFNDYLKK